MTYFNAVYRANFCLRFARGWSDYFKWLWEVATYFRERKCFRSIPPLGELDRKLVGRRTAVSENLSNITYTFELGHDKGRDDGLNVTWRTFRIDSLVPFLLRLGIPKDCGFVVSVDLLLRVDVTAQQARMAANELQILLNQQLNEELGRNKQFLGLFVSTGDQETETGMVLRVALAYRRQSSLDAWFAQALAPYCLSDILTDFTGSLTASLTPLDLVDDNYANLDARLTAKVRDCEGEW